MEKKKIIGLVLVLLIVAAVLYFLFFDTPEAEPWAELTDEEKIQVFENWFAGQGSVYIRPGTDEFDAMIEEVKALYQAAGLVWDEEEFIYLYQTANGTGSSSTSTSALSSSGSGGAISVSNRPGTNSVSNRPGTNEYNP